MLRNFDFDSLLVWVFALLNEVLSLNAQECQPVCGSCGRSPVLNEVLSLNAQEFVPIAGKTAAGLSSMKS